MTKSAGSALRLAILAPLLVAHTTSASGQDKDLVRQASIIFEGHVTQVGATTMRAVPASPDMAVVAVDRIIDKPAGVSMQSSEPVTVKLKQPGSLRPGDRAIFYTNGRLFGQGLAVEEVGHEMVSQQIPSSASGGRTSPDDIKRVRQELSEEALRERIRSAIIVAVGRVREVREPTAALQTRTDGGLRITEHDPHFAEAVIDVTDGIKGASSGGEVVIRFPTSKDVMWHTYPKFQVGQSGVFILQPDTLTGGVPATLRGAQVPVFTVPYPTDVLPPTEADRARNLAR